MTIGPQQLISSTSDFGTTLSPLINKERKKSLPYHVVAIQESNWSLNYQRQHNAQHAKATICKRNTTRNQRIASSIKSTRTTTGTDRTRETTIYVTVNIQLLDTIHSNSSGMSAVSRWTDGEPIIWMQRHHQNTITDDRFTHFMKVSLKHSWQLKNSKYNKSKFHLENSRCSIVQYWCTFYPQNLLVQYCARHGRYRPKVFATFQKIHQENTWNVQLPIKWPTEKILHAT